MPGSADDAPTPLLIVGGVDDFSPFLTVQAVCSRCRAVVASRQFDVRRDDKRGVPERLGVLDGDAWLAHVAGGCRKRRRRG